MPHVNTRRRGNVMIYMIIILPALFAVISLAVDLGRVQLVKSELQRAADAAARYAATGISDGSHASKAQVLVSQNTADGQSVTLGATDVERGNWNASASPKFSTARTPFNSVKVTVARTQARGNAVPLMFARLFGVDAADVTTSATAVASPASGGYGLVGLQLLNFNGNIVTDSYNSAAGPYSAASAGALGSAASNGEIKLNSTTVSRDVYMRPGQPLLASSSTYGSRRDNTSDLAFPLPTAGVYAGLNDNARITPANVLDGSTFDASSTAVTIPGGNYYFTSFEANNSTINVTGPATIYVDGDVDLNSLVMTVAGNLPSNLTFKVVKAGRASFKINSVANFWADIQAPTADVLTNSINGHFYGRIIGKTLTMNSNTRVHVDQSLPAIAGASSPSWDGSATAISMVE